MLLIKWTKNTFLLPPHLPSSQVFYPSVYTLWLFPCLLPVFTTWTPVMARIANGADLLLPGVIVDEEKGMKAYGEGLLEKGDSVAVNLANNLAPVAVGTAWLSSEDMYMAGRRGKCLSLIHFYGDQLWAAGTRDQIPALEPPSLPFLQRGGQEESDGEEEESGEEEVQEVADKIDNLKISEEVSETVVAKAAEPAPPDTRSSQEVMDSLLIILQEIDCLLILQEIDCLVLIL